MRHGLWTMHHVLPKIQNQRSACSHSGQADRFLIFRQMFFMSKRVEIAIDVCYNGRNNVFGEENCLRDKNFYSSLIAERCEYCRSARPIMGGKEIVCKYKGICSPFDRCRSYKYDPLKREPVIGDIGRNFDPDDLKL